MSETPASGAAAPDRRVPWVNLSAYGLSLFLLRSPSGNVHLLAGGQTDEQAERLSKYGMRPHPTHGRWHRSFKAGEQMMLAELRSVFPEMKVVLTDPGAFQLVLTRKAEAQEVATPAKVEAQTLPASIGTWGAQRGKAERYAAKLLGDLGLSERIVLGQDDEDFHARITNEPYMDLVIESHWMPRKDGGSEQQIYFTHYRDVGMREIAIDCEAVFAINPDMTLSLREMATMTVGGGEYRSLDRGFGAIFLRNLNDQGFARGQMEVTKEPRNAAIAAPLAAADDSLAPSAAHDDQPALHELATETPSPDATTEPTSGAEGAEAAPSVTAPRQAAAPELVDPDDFAAALLDVPQDGRPNYVVTDPEILRTRWNDLDAVDVNLRALQRLSSIEAGHEPEPEDLDALIQYVGWGGLPGVFAEGHSLYQRYNAMLRNIASPREYDEMRASTLNAHYTQHQVIDAIWAAALKAGFNGGRVLEAGAGTGLFLARVPEAVRDATRFVAVEKDTASARILRALYPRAKIFNTPYEQTSIPDDSVDLVIGNVPFGGFQVFDPAYKKLAPMIHDYFILKSLDKLRPGGVMLVITGTGTLDRQSPKIREALHRHGDLLGAFRLPDDAFAGNANTRVTADILLLRKRLPGEQPQPFDWRDCLDVEADSGESILVNGVFKTPRGHTLGYTRLASAMYGGVRNTVTRQSPRPGMQVKLLSEHMADVVNATPAGVHAPMRPKDIALAKPEARYNQKTYFDPKSEGAFVRVGVGDNVGAILNGQPTRIHGLNAKDEQRILDYMPLRDAVGALVQAQLDGCDDAKLQSLQEALHMHYDAFVKAHGRVADGRRNKNRRLLQDDPLFDAVHALEVLDDDNRFVRKAEIFAMRTVGAFKEIRCENAADALMACIDELGGVHPEWIAEQAKKPWEECVAELQGQIFRDPATGKWDIASRYLSGNVREKLRIATGAARDNPVLQENVQALEARLPKWLGREEITCSLGMAWVPVEHVYAFVCEVYGKNPGGKDGITVERRVTNEWVVNVPKWFRCEAYDAKGMNAAESIEAALNGRAARVTKPDDNNEKKRVVDEVATAMAIEKQRELKEWFERWIWADDDRANTLEGIYNELFNSVRSPDYRGIKVTVPGMAAGRALREHQETGVARSLLEDNVLLAHPVGFGKTATMSATGVKLRAVFGGKTCVVTPKNVINQFAGEAKRWFPTARVLCVKSEDLTPSGRARFWRRVQVTNPDLIVTTPEAFKRLRLSRDTEAKFLMDEIGHLQQVLARAEEGEKTGARQIKQVEKILVGKNAQLSKLLNIEEKDDARVTLSDLGIRTLMVDECHRFKSLQVDSSEQILGIPTSASQRAFDMLSKVRFLQDSGGKVVFATGSMITNTVAEVFNMQRYLQPDLLKATAVDTFDAWRAQFADTVQSLEPDPAGKGYQIRNRLATIVNVPELVRMLGQFVDSVPDTNAYFERPTPIFETVSVEPTPLQQKMREALAERVKEIRERQGPPQKGDDNILCVLGDARRAALDLRALYPTLPGQVGGQKLTEVADRVASIHATTSGQRGAQAVFLDIGTPRAKAGDGFNAYEALAQELVARGVPREQVAFIHDAKDDEGKLMLYRRVREGSVRVIVGSTEKMGEGANIQDRLAALHHLNAPYHPGAVVQRNGRIVRNGNLYKDVRIITYVTKGLLEDWNWHLVTLKAGFINQIMDGMACGRDGDGLARKIVEESGSMAYDEIEAEASDNPLVRRKCVVDAEVKKLDLLRSAWGQQKSSQRSRLWMAKQGIETSQDELAVLLRMQAAIEAAKPLKAERRAAALAADKAREAEGDLLEPARPKVARMGPAVVTAEDFAAAADDKDSGDFLMTVHGRHFATRRLAGLAVLVAAAEAQKQAYRSAQVIGEIDGVALVYRPAMTGEPSIVLAPLDETTRRVGPSVWMSSNPVGMTVRLTNAVDSIGMEVAKAQRRIADYERTIDELGVTVDAAWPHEAKFGDARKEQSEINIELAKMNTEASGEGLEGFHRELLAYGINPVKVSIGGDDFDLAAAMAELGQLDAGPESDNDDGADESDRDVEVDVGVDAIAAAPGRRASQRMG